MKNLFKGAIALLIFTLLLSGCGTNNHSQMNQRSFSNNNGQNQQEQTVHSKNGLISKQPIAFDLRKEHGQNQDNGSQYGYYTSDYTYPQQANQGTKTTPYDTNDTNNNSEGDNNQSSQQQPSANKQSDSAIQKVVQLVNDERKKHGLPALKVDSALMDMADKKANDMLNNHYFSHTSPTYGSPFDMMNKLGIEYTSAGENIAEGQTDAQKVMDDWMNSPGHRANILNKSYTYIGVGHTDQSDYWVQEFIKK